MKKLILAVLAVWGLNAAAATWNAITASDWPPLDNSATVVEADVSSIRMREGFRQAWVRYNYQPIKKSSSGFGPGVGSSASLQIFDCRNAESATMQYVEYGERFGRGEVGHTSNNVRGQAIKNMTARVPDSYGDFVLQFVCAFPLK